jgi:anti-anti-sigma factor
MIQSRITGHSSTILVVLLPAQLVDETASLVRETVSSRLPNADGAGLVLDFSEVELINSIGITCLLQVQDHCRRQGAALFVAALSTPIQTFLSQLKLAKRFPSVATVEDAIAKLDGV